MTKLLKKAIARVASGAPNRVGARVVGKLRCSRALEPCTRRSFAIGVAPEAPDDDEDAIPAIGRRCSAISTLCTASS